MTVSHEEHADRGSFFIEQDGERVGEMTYRRRGDAVMRIDHTEVKASLRRQGIARRLLDAAVAHARQSGARIEPRCPYVTVQFERDPAIADVRAL
jgi:predicted GNAT family acetyltransferase